MSITRRSLLNAAAIGAVATAFPFRLFGSPESKGQVDQFHSLRVGACSYSLRNAPRDQMLNDVHRLGVQYLSLKEVHLPLDSTTEERRQTRQQAQDLGLSITSCGVIYMKNDADLMHKAFDYAHDVGASLVVVGVNREMLSTLDMVIRDYDLKAAIHNHGPKDKLFPSPLEVWEAIQPFHRKIGICMDIGHTYRMHEDLVADVQKTKDRLYSMHFKDLDSDRIDAKGVPVGTGVLPTVDLLRELVRLNYTGEVQLEYEVEPNDPVPGMAESFGFMRGALRAM